MVEVSELLGYIHETNHCSCKMYTDIDYSERYTVELFIPQTYYISQETLWIW